MDGKKPGPTPKTPVCHPDRKHKAKGLCYACYDKQIYWKDPESKKAKHQKWSQRNKVHLRDYTARRKLRLDPVTVVLGQVKHGAKKRGIPFALTEEDLRAVWTGICPVLGIPIQLNIKRCPNSISVDRIDNSVGYVPGNICVMSWRANRLKADGSLDELKAVVRFLEGLSALKLQTEG